LSPQAFRDDQKEMSEFEVFLRLERHIMTPKRSQGLGKPLSVDSTLKLHVVFVAQRRRQSLPRLLL
jgi:hypothetical protein